MRGDAPALVIGGTGMLAAATRWLAARSAGTVLVARRASAFDMAGAAAVDADWSDPGFRPRVEAALDAAPSVGRALLWLHEPAPVLPWLLPRLAAARVVLVLGSLDGDPLVPATAGEVVTVRLGSIAVPGGRRWLTHAEISTAAVAALEDGRSRQVGEPVPAG